MQTEMEPPRRARLDGLMPVGREDIRVSTAKGKRSVSPTIDGSMFYIVGLYF